MKSIIIITCRSGGDGSNSTPSSQSSTNSSQDSLHKPAAKKKSGGLKTSIGRIFSKKEKMASKDSPVVPRGYHTLPNPHRSSMLQRSLLCFADSYCLSLWAHGAWGRCRISPPHFLAECRKRRLNQGSFVSAVCLVVCFL